jgi:hypothetical protein
LRWYPRDAWLGWRPLGSPLATEFDDPAEVDAIVERVRRCGRVEAGELRLPASGDSWPAFCREHGTYEFYEPWRPEHLRDTRPQPARPVSMRAQREQEKWEAAQRERWRVKQAESDALWHAEEQRQQAAAAAAEQYDLERRARDQQLREAEVRALGDYQRVAQDRLTATLMDQWNAIVARHGWSPDEAATYWNGWLTGPPGMYG